MVESLESASPISDAEALSLARRWKHHGSVLITGPPGSGRRSLGAGIAATRDPSIPVLRADIRPGIGVPNGGLLEELGLYDGREASISTVETISSRLAAKLGPTTILVLGAGAADERSLRTLLHLARISPTIRVVLVDDDTHGIGERLAGRPDSPVRLSLPAMSGEVLERTVHRLIGMTPSAYDVIALEKRSGGCFRSVCWLVDLARCNDRMVRRNGMFHMLHVDGHEEVLPDWQHRPDLLRSEATNVLSLAGTLTLSTLDALGLLPDLTELEAKGDVRISGQCVRLSSTAVRWEAASRQPPAARRLRVSRLLEVLTPQDLEVLDAVDLARWCERSGMDVPREVALRAVSAAAETGNHEAALRIATEMGAEASPKVLGDLAFSFAVLDEVDLVVEAARKTIDRGGDLCELESMGMALFVGRLRRPQDEDYLRASEDLLAAVGALDARSAVVLRGFLDLACTTADARRDPPDLRAIATGTTALLEDDDLSSSTRRRAWILLAVLEWLGGRPQSALRRLESLPEEEAPFEAGATDVALLTFLRAAGAFLSPDLDATRRVLESAVGDWPIPRTLRLVWVIVALNRGETTTARIMADPFLAAGRRQRKDSVLTHLGAAATALAGAMLREPELAEALLAREVRSGSEGRAIGGDAGRPEREVPEEPTSVYLSAARLHLLALTAAVLDPVAHRQLVKDLFTGAAEEAESAGFITLAVIGTYRRARTVQPRLRDELWSWLSTQLSAEGGLDGVPELYARIGRATVERDSLGLADLVTELHAAQMVQDAAALSAWIVSRGAADLPDATRRVVARTARQSAVGGGASERSILTPKEREVASLVQTGMTDQAIADHLGSSRRTVSTHVGRILRKLLIESRYELTAELAAQHGVPVQPGAAGTSSPT